MTAPVLKRSLGEAGAAIDESHGAPSRLYDVMKALLKAGVPLQAAQAGAISAGVKARTVAQFDGVIGDIGVRVGVCGTAGSTTVVVNKNGTPLATAPAAIANTDPDPTSVSKDLSGDAAAAFVKGDVIDIEVTAAGTGATDLDATLHLRPASIEP